MNQFSVSAIWIKDDPARFGLEVKMIGENTTFHYANEQFQLEHSSMTPTGENWRKWPVKKTPFTIVDFRENEAESEWYMKTEDDCLFRIFPTDFAEGRVGEQIHLYCPGDVDHEYYLKVKEWFERAERREILSIE